MKYSKKLVRQSCRSICPSVPDSAALELGELSAVDELAGREGARPAALPALLGARQHLGADEHVARQAGELDLGADRSVVAGHPAACDDAVSVTRCTDLWNSKHDNLVKKPNSFCKQNPFW